MKKLLEQNNLLKPVKVGEIIEAKIAAKDRRSVILDLGTRGTGIVYGKEFLDAKDILRDLKIGDKVFAKVVELKNEEGYIELSLSQVGEEMTWEELRQKKEKEEVIEIKITGANKGGLISEISGIQGFLPVSQLSQENYPKVEGGDSSKILKELQKFINKEMKVLILDLNQKEGKLIFSERAKDRAKIKELLKNYKVGDVVEGEVSGIVDFGVFVRFGKENLEGLIHISELDWKIVQDPADIVHHGQKIKAKIINISNDKVFLSLKALKKDPWEGIEQIYKKGDIVSGKVIKLSPFGAFVKVTDQIQGLCHISDLGPIEEMEEKLKIGEKYKFEISEIKPNEHRMFLKLIQENGAGAGQGN